MLSYSEPVYYPPYPASYSAAPPYPYFNYYYYGVSNNFRGGVVQSFDDIYFDHYRPMVSW